MTTYRKSGEAVPNTVWFAFVKTRLTCSLSKTCTFSVRALRK
jgi:hypothetical protein